MSTPRRPRPLPASEVLSIPVGGKLKQLIEDAARAQGLSATSLVHRVLRERFTEQSVVLVVDATQHTLDLAKVAAEWEGLDVPNFVRASLRRNAVAVLREGLQRRP